MDEMPSMEAKQKERDALAKAMEEFLARGGKVQEVEANVVADPPKSRTTSTAAALSEWLNAKSPPSLRAFCGRGFCRAVR